MDEISFVKDYGEMKEENYWLAEEFNEKFNFILSDSFFSIPLFCPVD